MTEERMNDMNEVKDGETRAEKDILTDQTQENKEAHFEQCYKRPGYMISILSKSECIIQYISNGNRNNKAHRISN